MPKIEDGKIPYAAALPVEPEGDRCTCVNGGPLPI